MLAVAVAASIFLACRAWWKDLGEALCKAFGAGSEGYRTPHHGRPRSSWGSGSLRPPDAYRPEGSIRPSEHRRRSRRPRVPESYRREGVRGVPSDRGSHGGPEPRAALPSDTDRGTHDGGDPEDRSGFEQGGQM